MINISCGRYTFSCTLGHLPDMYNNYCRHAELVCEYGLHEPKENSQSESPYFIGISKNGHNDGWPFLTVSQTYSPDNGGFHPGAVIIAETDILMIGAGIRVLCYTLDPPRLLWEDDVDCGFWGWERYGDIIVMAAELEMAAWDIEGRKLWSRFVEPPWSYKVEGDLVLLNIMDDQSSFPLKVGPDI